MSMAGAPTNKGTVEVERELMRIFGFVPQLFRVQGAEPRLLAAVVRLLDEIVLTEGRLSRTNKEGLFHVVCGALGNQYAQSLFATASSGDEVPQALTDLALRLACHGPWFSAKEVERATRAGFDEQAILEVVATCAAGRMICVLADALQPSGDSERPLQAVSQTTRPVPPDVWEQPSGPYLNSKPQGPPGFGPFLLLREQLGFIPNLFRAQMWLPDLVAAEAGFLDQIVLEDVALTRIQKEKILLMVSAANLNTYGVALQRQILDGLGVGLEESDAMVNDLPSAAISAAERALLAEVRTFTPGLDDRFRAEVLEGQGFTRLQIVEAVAVAAFATFLNTVQYGLGVIPDFPPARIFSPKDLYPERGEGRPTPEELYASDPDAGIVRQVQGGTVDVFEVLVRRHSARVFGTLAGIVGNVEDARDATQDVFLKAFEKIAGFEGRSRFSTWLISIAINTGMELLRRRKRTEPMDATDDDEDFRPRQIQQWADNPEQIISAAQRNDLVRRGILQLPESYRVALILRDIIQLSSEDAAAALAISVPALKARVLRGRLMLRERLAPHFTRDREHDDA